MPRPAPRVAPATTATRPVSGFLPATGRVRDLAASGDCLGRPAIAIPPDANHRRINRCVSTGVWSVRKGLRRSVALCRLERLHFSGRVTLPGNYPSIELCSGTSEYQDDVAADNHKA